MADAKAASTVDEWKIQLSLKYGNGNMLNLRTQTVDEMVELTTDLGNQGAFLVGATEEFQALATIQQAFPATQQIQPQASAPAPAGYGNGARVCAHGVAMTQRSGVSKSSGKPWSGWFCQVKSDPSLPECPAQFAR